MGKVIRLCNKEPTVSESGHLISAKQKENSPSLLIFCFPSSLLFPFCEDIYVVSLSRLYILFIHIDINWRPESKRV